MKRWAVLAICILLLFSGPLSMKSEADGGCGLCILEIGTATNIGEDYDFVIIGNITNSSISLSSVQLQYFNSLGVYDSRINLSGTLLPGQVKIFASEPIKTFNPNVSTLTFSMHSSGGSLKLIKVLVASTTLYDTVGWGSASVFETAAVNSDSSEVHFYRKLDLDGLVVDTDNNSLDFEPGYSDCSGVYINEIQPFATDTEGQAMRSWVEFVQENQTLSACSFASSSGRFYDLSPDIYGAIGDIFGVDTYSEGGVSKYLELPNPSGTLAVAEKSIYISNQPLLMPISIVTYNGLVKGQSYAKVIEYDSSVWRATYVSTEGEENIYAPDPPVAISGLPDACEGVVINEITPNPSGSDTGLEWLEILNTNSSTKNLGQCFISVEEEKYYFSEDSNIGAGEFQKYQTLLNEYGDSKDLSLRNTDPTLVSLSRLYGDESYNLQSFIYEEAPEAMSYSRFEEGWAWTYSITPEAANVFQPIKPVQVVTESKASFATSILKSSANSSVVSTKKTSTKKSSTSTKSLSTAAKSATGAKSVNSERDVYQEPEKLESNNNGGYVFVLIGVMAVIYAMYEYKTDIQNYFLKRRRNKELRGEDRQAA